VTRFAKFSIASLLAVVAAVGGLGGLNLYTYQRFTQESILGTLEFRGNDTDSYLVSWTPVQGKHKTFELRGDEWQLDVRMIKWTNWLTFLGKDPLYRLDRISGRYVEAEMARRNPPDIEDLAEQHSVDVWDFARRSGDWLPGVDAAYGTSVYLPMDDGVAYEVLMTRTGLIARKTANPAH
jgi:hypothetical protein